MKTFVVILVVTVLGVAFWLFFLTGPSFGVGGDSPIGSADEIGEYLREKDLYIGDAPGKETVARFFGEKLAAREDVSVTRWNDRVPGYPHFVLVVLDRTGKVIAVGGQFRSGMREFSTVGSRTQGFLARLWLAVAGDEPEYREKRFGARDRDFHLQAEWSDEGVRGFWRKTTGGGMAMPHQTTDLVGFVTD